MDGFVPEEEALNMSDTNNLADDSSQDEYISPLALSQPSLPIQHYDPSGAYTGPRRPTPKKNYGGFCDLCNVKLNSYLQSKSHYEGKPHARKVKAAERTKKPSNSDDGPPSKKAREEPVTALYCKPCNLTFTSEAHAKDHYLGRNHARVLHGLKPFEPGYFNNTTNKWQRTPPDPRVSAQLLSSEPPTDVDGRPAHQEKPRVRGRFVCELCNCSLTCEEQLQSHLAGSRHSKVLKKQEALQKEADKSGGESDTSTTDKQALRCSPCDIAFNSIIQKQQHMSSKKHMAKVTRLQRKQEAEQEQESMENSLAEEREEHQQYKERYEQREQGQQDEKIQPQFRQRRRDGQKTPPPDVNYDYLQDLQNVYCSPLTGPCTDKLPDNRVSNS